METSLLRRSREYNEMRETIRAADNCVVSEPMSVEVVETVKVTETTISDEEQSNNGLSDLVLEENPYDNKGDVQPEVRRIVDLKT